MNELKHENENLDNQIYEKNKQIQRLSEEKDSALYLRAKDVQYEKLYSETK